MLSVAHDKKQVLLPLPLQPSLLDVTPEREEISTNRQLSSLVQPISFTAVLELPDNEGKLRQEISRQR